VGKSNLLSRFTRNELPGEQVHHRRGVCHPQHTGGLFGKRCVKGRRWALCGQQQYAQLQRTGTDGHPSTRIKPQKAPTNRTTPTTRATPSRWTARPSRRRSGTLRGRSGTAPSPALTTGGPWGRCWCTTSPSQVGRCRCAVLCCAVLCCAVLCCAVLCCAVLCCEGVACCVLRGGKRSVQQICAVAGGHDAAWAAPDHMHAHPHVDQPN